MGVPEGTKEGATVPQLHNTTILRFHKFGLQPHALLWVCQEHPKHCSSTEEHCSTAALCLTDLAPALLATGPCVDFLLLRHLTYILVRSVEPSLDGRNRLRSSYLYITSSLCLPSLCPHCSMFERSVPGRSYSVLERAATWFVKVHPFTNFPQAPEYTRAFSRAHSVLSLSKRLYTNSKNLVTSEPNLKIRFSSPMPNRRCGSVEASNRTATDPHWKRNRTVFHGSR